MAGHFGKNGRPRFSFFAQAIPALCCRMVDINTIGSHIFFAVINIPETVMTEKNGSFDEQQSKLLELVKSINKCWLKGNPDDIAPFFHEKMVMVRPGYAGKIAGITSCVQSYKDFIRDAAVTDYKESDYKIDIVENTAVVMYRYEIGWNSKNQSFHEKGHDLFIFALDGENWKAIWRTIVPE